MAFDLDALDVERTGKPFAFTWDGAGYELPSKADILTLSIWREGRMMDGFERLLGPDQLVRLKASPKVFTTEHLVALVDAYYKHIGTTPGKAPAPSKRSKSTATPSSRTSRGTTRSI